ncbi:MAG: patatin-like phospholipase family protein [Chloroflexi bacterium]|nr:patatin-like phospholipase family protein [Chloroflexota bacterium]
MKLGVALGGGGAKGLAHLGALRVVESTGARIEYVAGTSAGAIVGALYAAGKSLDEIEAIMRRWTLLQLLAFDRTGMGLFSTDGLRHALEIELGRTTRIEEFQRKFACVAVDLEAQAEVVFDAGMAIDAVCASAAFPGFFAPVKIGERTFIDGGALNPVPCDVARRLGAERVIAIDLSADVPVFTTAGARPLNRDALVTAIVSSAENRKIVRVTARAIGVMSKLIRETRLAQAPPDIIIHPNVQHVGLMDFDMADDCFAAGEASAREQLAQIQRLMTPPTRWQTIKQQWRVRLVRASKRRFQRD